MSATGTLFVISAPSGAGKTSLVAALLENISGLSVSVSHTTRAKRPGEENGVNYHFVGKPEFEQLISEGAFLEYAQVFDNFYGTSRSAVMRQMAGGDDVILEIDWQGAAQVKKLIPECVSIFILPPSRSALNERLTGRGQDDQATIDKRLAEAKSEMTHYHEADYLVINDDFDTALSDLGTIISSQKLFTQHQQLNHADLIEELLL